MRLERWGAAAVFLLGLTPAQAAAPDAFATCDLMSGYLATLDQPHLRPDVRPTLWWITEAVPCELGTELMGAPPPNGRSIGCEDRRSRKFGWRTEFAGDGKVLLESHWDDNREIGPRIEWDPVTYKVNRVTQFKNGRQEGQVVEWLHDGGVLVTTFKKGAREGPMYRLDERGGLLLVESWRADARHGRSCAWRGDAVSVEQVFMAGRPTVRTGQ